MGKNRKVIRLHKNGGIYIELPWTIDTPTTWIGISIIDLGRHEKNKIDADYTLRTKSTGSVELVLEKTFIREEYR